MKNLKTSLQLVFAAMGAASAFASFTPYPTPGSPNPTTYSFVATGPGNVTAYFVGETAGFGSVVGMSVNGGPVGTFGLQNHSTAYGASLDLGAVVAGDIINFVMEASTDYFGPPPVSYVWYSNPALNSDGQNHVYSTSFTTDGTIPNGTYVGFEDLPDLGDRDYDDHQFVFTGPFEARPTPDGGSTAALMGLASLGMVALRRKQK